MGEASVLRIHTDGASRGNPGAAAYAYVIARDGAETLEEAGCLGTMTNNQAEYTALVRALEHALELGAEHRLLIHSDSELLVKQMNGEYRVKNEELRDLYQQARGLCARFPGGVTLRHVRRAENSRADALCNEALDGLRLPMPRMPGARKATVAPTSAPAAAPAATLRQQALQCLHQAARAWTASASEPTPEAVWQQLVALLRQHGVTLPQESR